MVSSIMYPLYAAIVSIILWILRGNTWPVRCLYPITSRRRPCEHWIAGEWYRCRHHNWRASYKYGQEVDSTIKRWQRADRNGNLIDRPAIGVGVLRVRPSGHALLYQKGYARKSLDVVKLVPEFLKKTFRRLGGMRFRVSNRASPVTTAASVGITEMKNSVAEGLLSVVQATQFATVTFGFALLTTLISVFLRAAPQPAAQWVATLGFVLAWAAVSSGVYQKSDEWLYGTCTKSLSGGVFSSFR
jgi:hypothetical protein